MIKKLPLILAYIAISTILNAQNVHIPDANFKNYLLGNNTINTNYDNEIQVSEAAAFAGTLNIPNKSISDLTGIEAFTALTALVCRNNSLSSLDLTQNIALRSLMCDNNSISSLDLSQNLDLYALQCQNNLISSIDVSQSPNFYKLECQNNTLTTLNIANGNNANFSTGATAFIATGNPNLMCIKIDAGFTPPTFWQKDSAAIYSANCGVLINTITVKGQGDVSTINSIGASLQMFATISPVNAINDTYTWSVTDGTGSATINTSGLLTATTIGTVTVTATANDASGAIGTKEITIANPDEEVNIKDLAFKNLNIHPNPTNGLLNLEIAETLSSIKLMDLTGKVVKVFDAEIMQLDISVFPSGIYFLEIANAEKKSVLKIIKK